MLVVEQATERIFEALNRKFEILTSQLGDKFNIGIEEICSRKEDNRQKTSTNSKITTIQHQIAQDPPTAETQNENDNPSITPINGTKRKYISPSDSSDKTANTENNSRI
ncbi:unnamed protein product [Rotaria sordida]|uniref:Uncharacterized protein n=1 Tax=Rotaria sordida TaxID=392033 RepID=A0A815G8F4_9BILA|nr:unnamed protein product [Rotaria sordida]CAF3846379.1 unnamed protein product [Rotaria sordida]CAF4000987.1 unnamed protein product [Rotaria sordida]